jgi:hypothetical protein
VLKSGSLKTHLSQREVLVDVRGSLLADDRTDDVRRATSQLQQPGAVAPDVPQLRKLAQTVLH